jgi:hypothetical protein
MGRFLSIALRIARSSRTLLFAAGLASAISAAHAQTYATIQNQYLVLGIGNGATTNGSIFLQSSASNPSNPTARTPITILFGGPVETTNNATVSEGTVVYIRVDGGKSAGGNDYIFGRQTEGTWLQVPTATADKITARWQTASQVVNTKTIDPRVEIDLVASFVHDQARFQFTIKNNSPGRTHTVGIAFLQDIVAGKQDLELGGPIRVPNGPYLRHEALLQGDQVPPFFDIFVLGAIPATTNIPGGPSIRGFLAPLSGETEPTRPTRFGYGDLGKLSGVGSPIVNPIFVGRDFDFIWNFRPDPTADLSTVNNAVIDYWDGQAVGVGQVISDVTYIGQATTQFDFSPPITLGVSGPLALGLTTTKDANGNPTACVVTPSTFTINAYAQNQTDLSPTSFPSGAVSLFLDLPKGLVLAPGETNPKTIANIVAGQESGVSWQVTTDNTASGKLSYTVTESSLVGKSVQGTIEVPLPAVFDLLGTDTTQGLYRMVSFPLIFGNAPPSTILGLNDQPPVPEFDLARWNPVQGHYEPVNTFVPGLAYWLRSRLKPDRPIIIDCLKYPPLDNQVQPTAAPYKINYPRGWNQIGSPDIYNVRFSEVQVFDQATSTQVDAVTAADQEHQWIQPAVFFYDTSDTNPQNWHYVLESSFGFDMVPYQGYWILCKRDGLLFSYPGVDTPGASVTRSALIGVGMAQPGSRVATNDWNVQLKAKGTVSTDFTTTIGVNSKATDQNDYYKVVKPPVQENQLALDIVHDDWAGGGRYAKDLRSASPTRKTWNMVLTSSRPNEAVTFSWPNLAVSVPRSYRLTLVDTDSNTRNVQVIAEPTRGGGQTVITSFDVVTQAGGPGRAVASVSINYTLSQQADTRIVIRTSGGRVLRTLTGQPLTGSSANSGRAVFDMRDSQGRLISTGVYQAEITAQSTDGQVTRQVRPFVLAR